MGILTKGQYKFGNKTKAQIIALNASTALTGTASISSGGTTVTGVGTLFLTQLLVGDVIQFTAGNSFIVATIASNTSLTVTTASTATISGSALNLVNPRRIKAGDSVYNTTDRYPMYYSGDGQGFISLTAWKSGNFVNGQVVPVRNASETTSITEGQVMTTSSATAGTALAYSATVSTAIAVSYQLVLGGACIPMAICGIHNTDASGAITKSNFTTPAAASSAVTDQGTSTAVGTCGVACTANGTPAAGEVEMLVNFIERL